MLLANKLVNIQFFRAFPTYNEDGSYSLFNEDGAYSFFKRIIPETGTLYNDLVCAIHEFESRNHDAFVLESCYSITLPEEE